MITSRESVIAAVRANQRHGLSEEVAIEKVADALHLPVDTVREILQEAQPCS